VQVRTSERLFGTTVAPLFRQFLKFSFFEFFKVFLDYFDVVMPKINFKKLKNYFNIFLKEKYFKK